MMEISINKLKINKEGFRIIPCEDDKPDKIKEYKLYQHQLNALEWMKNIESHNISINHNIKGGIICATMGSGKTLLSLEHCLFNRKKEIFPSLIICSASLLTTSWKVDGVEKFYKDLNVLYFHNTCVDVDNVSIQDILDSDVVITTYDVCRNIFRLSESYTDNITGEINVTTKTGLKIPIIINRDIKTVKYTNEKVKNMDDLKRNNIKGKNLLYDIQWSRIILDESQRACNPSTKTFKSLMGLYCNHLFCMSGTPIKNNNVDFWSHLRLIGYDGVILQSGWKKNYYYFMNEYHLQDYILIIDLQDTNIILPEKLSNNIFIKLQTKVDILYKIMNDIMKKMCIDFLAKKIHISEILGMFTKLRQCCLTPYLIFMGIDKKEKKSKKTPLNEDNTQRTKCSTFMDDYKFIYEDKKTYINECPKIKHILDIIKKTPKNEKILIFSSFKSFLKLVENVLTKNKIKSLSINGSTKISDRGDIKKLFEQDDEYRCLFLTYKTGSEGLNLTCASNIILCEPWWNNTSHNQAIARAWRNGQQNNVNVYNLIMDNTIEIKLLSKCKSKDIMSNNLLRDKVVIKKRIEKLDVHEILKLLSND